MLTSVFGFMLGMICAFIYENLPFKKVVGVNKLIVRGYRLHHSLYGLILITTSLFFWNYALILISSGFGVIFEHALTGGGLDFITKER